MGPGRRGGARTGTGVGAGAAGSERTPERARRVRAGPETWRPRQRYGRRGRRRTWGRRRPWEGGWWSWASSTPDSRVEGIGGRGRGCGSSRGGRRWPRQRRGSRRGGRWRRLRVRDAAVCWEKLRIRSQGSTGGDKASGVFFPHRFISLDTKRSRTFNDDLL